MRKRRRNRLCFIVKTCILMMLSLTFFLYVTSDGGYNKANSVYDSVEWDEYFRKVQKDTKRPSPEILERLKEGMSRLGNDHVNVPYMKFAESKIRKIITNRTTNATGLVRKFSEVGRHERDAVNVKEDDMKEGGEGKSSKQNESTADSMLAINEGANPNLVESEKVVRRNILPYIPEYVTSHHDSSKLGYRVEDVKTHYEIAAKQNRQYLQLDKRTLLSAGQYVGNHTKRRAKDQGKNEAESLMGALKGPRRFVREGPPNTPQMPGHFQNVALKSNPKTYKIDKTLGVDDDTSFTLSFQLTEKNTSNKADTNSINHATAGRRSLVAGDAYYNLFHTNLKSEVRLSIDDAVFWSDFVEKHLETGLSDDDILIWSYKARHQEVIELKTPDWKTCGRPKNQLVIMKDGSRMCARYRHPHNELVQGEVYSFYLATLLGIRHVPAIVLSLVNSTSTQWRAQAERIQQARWEEGTLVALIQWIDNLERGKLPSIFQEDGLVSYDSKRLQQLSVEEIVELMQWTDLIIFDYITGNYDRIASNQDAAEKEHNPHIMTENIHNLRKDKHTNTIWLIDNESGFLDGYELMRNPTKSAEARRFVSFHRRMLDSVCVFRKSTFENVKKLHLTGNPAGVLRAEVRKHEPLSKFLPKIPKKLNFDQTMKRRIADVYERFQICQNRILMNTLS